MSRLIFQRQRLQGQTLDASAQPDGHARQSLFELCDLSDVTFIGDWRGTDYLSSTSLRTNWTQAQTYASIWDKCPLTNAQFPVDIGFLHHEPAAEILKQTASRVLARYQPWVDEISVETRGDITRTISWNSRLDLWWDRVPARERQLLVREIRKLFTDYHQLATRFEGLAAELLSGIRPTPARTRRRRIVRWRDGVTVDVDADNLPSLPDPSRYALSRWIEQQAGPGHYCFVYSIIPLLPLNRRLDQEETWLSHRLQGY